MRRNFIPLIIFIITALSTQAQITMLKQHKLKKWNIPPANYSGITPLGNNHYAVICDKQHSDGYYEFKIEQNSETGDVENVELITFHANKSAKAHDTEGIVFVPSVKTLFIAAEDNQSIKEYTLQGKPTKRELSVPEALQKHSIAYNYGFESLAFSNKTELFWTCTESNLLTDGEKPSVHNPVPALLRIQSFGLDMQPKQQYIYHTDIPTLKSKPKFWGFGVAELTALDDGSLLVLEREFLTTPNYIGSYVTNKIYKIEPAESPSKTLQAEWTTKFNITRRNLANYEGMCLGAKLKDGRQTILLISDSQGGKGKAFYHMKDYIKVGIME